MNKLSIFPIASLLCFNCFAQQSGVGINSDGSAPAASAMLDVKSTDKGMLIPRMTTLQRTAIANVVKGLLVFDNSTSSFWFYNGTAWVELASGSGSSWVGSGTHISNSNSGNVGINTSEPTQKLDVNGNIRSRGRVDASGVIEGNGVSSSGAFYVAGTSYMDGAVTVNNSASFSGNINSNAGMTITAPTGTLQYKDGATEKAFVQISGNDLRLGTNSTNNDGKLIVRTQGANRVAIDNEGINLLTNGKITRSTTGSTNLLPICYGRVKFMATSYTGTPNFTATYISTGDYEIDCPQFGPNTVIVVTMHENQGGTYAYPHIQNNPAGSTKYRLQLRSISLSQPADAGFSFIAY